MGKLWRGYGLGIAFMLLFLFSWGMMTWTGWNEYVGQQHAHHEKIEVFGSGGYIWNWGERTFSNWQADFLGQGAMIILAAYLIYRNSSQSKEGDEEMQQALARIEERLEKMERAGWGAPADGAVPQDGASTRGMPNQRPPASQRAPVGG